MNRQNNVPFNPPTIPKNAVSGYNPRPPRRVPQQFMEAMKRIPVSAADNSNIRTDMAAKSPPAKKCAAKSDAKWMSSFKPVDKQDVNSQDEGTSSSERTELYDPYDVVSSDSEPELPQAQDPIPSPPSQLNNLERQRLSPGRGCLDSRHWDSPYSERGSRPLDRPDFISGTRPSENRSLSPGHRLPEQRAYSPDAESLDHPGYGSKSSPLDQRSCSPDRLTHSSSTRLFRPPYGGQGANGEERITLPEYRRKMATIVRLSPPRLRQDHHRQLAYVETGLDPPSTKATRSKNKVPITCDLCEVELANGQELEDHLDSKSHWDTLEHIQQNNHYDDMVIAFLQEVMMYKSSQCSRAIEDSALPALQENDYMTKVEMFHCAACKVFISTSADDVQTHISSQEHLSNAKEFEVQQRHACLSKAETMMKELKPQFEHFLEGGSPFE